jgi:hypothetical protein
MIIQCKFETIRHDYTCDVLDAVITERCKIESFEGQHEAGKSCKDVETLWFWGGELRYLPSGLHKFFPKLNVLRVTTCQLREITSSDLFGLEKLHTLILLNNELESLPDDLFMHNRNIHIINFTGNNLKVMSSRLFDPIPDDQWSRIDFRENTNIDTFCEPAWNNGLKSIKELREVIDLFCKQHPTTALHCKFDFIEASEYICAIRSNSAIIKRYEVVSFIGQHQEGKSNSDVETLIFQDTTIHYLPTGLHKIYPRLKRLIVDNCGLKEMTPCNLFGLKHLECVWIEQNLLKMLPDDLFYHTKNLKSISFTDNELEFMSSRLLDGIADQLEYASFRGNRSIDAIFWPESDLCLESVKDLKSLMDSTMFEESELCVTTGCIERDKNVVF